LRISSSSPSQRLVRVALGVSFLALAGCGGGSSTVPNSFGLCDANAQSISIARPTPGYPMNGNQIEIVSSTNQDQLNGSPNAFDLNLVDNFGNEIDTGGLNAVPDPNGPHPYGSDFFYAATLNASLLGGRTYNVYLNAPSSSCQRGLIGQIFT
jgi:hypothetical protein